jgi:hypothetical protein
VNLFKTILILSTCLLSTISLVAQNKFVAGVILNLSDTTPISNAHVINVNSSIGVTSNQQGSFSIQAKLADTLLISFVGYQPFKVCVSEIESTIYLERAIHTLEPYTVLPYQDFNAFKEAFTNLQLKDTLKHKMNHSIMALVQPFNPANLNGSLSFSGPISALASKFNKRIKDKKNYDRLIARDQHKAFLGTKFNSEIVKQATLLQEAYQINAFMDYCDFTNHFIEHSSHYTIVDQIITCFEEYHHLPMANK